MKVTTRRRGVQSPAEEAPENVQGQGHHPGRARRQNVWERLTPSRQSRRLTRPSRRFTPQPSSDSEIADEVNRNHESESTSTSQSDDEMTERNVQRGNRNPDERGIPDEQIIPNETVFPNATVISNETVIPNATIIPNETRIPVPNVPIVENRPTNQNAINPNAELLVLLRQQMQQQQHQQQMQMLLETFANQRPQTSSLKPYDGFRCVSDTI